MQYWCSTNTPSSPWSSLGATGHKREGGGGGGGGEHDKLYYRREAFLSCVLKGNRGTGEPRYFTLPMAHFSLRQSLDYLA